MSEGTFSDVAARILSQDRANFGHREIGWSLDGRFVRFLQRSENY